MKVKLTEARKARHEISFADLSNLIDKTRIMIAFIKPRIARQSNSQYKNSLGNSI